MNPLHSRNTSGFALSISTGLAMETLFQPRQDVFDPGRVSPPRISLAHYGQLWINVLTLIRNAYNATDRQYHGLIRGDHMAEAILQEMELIRDLLSIEGQGTTYPMFYFTDYHRLFKNVPDLFKMREDRTPTQHLARSVYYSASELITRNDTSVQNLKSDIQGSQAVNSLMFTHLPLDLLSYRNFRELDLLESHTGKIKSKNEWNTKYHKLGEEDMSRLPFCRQLLYVFGDTPSISPGSIRDRRDILAVAKEAKWTPATSPQRVHTDLGLRLPNAELLTALKAVPIF